jgi:hypothetical protein
MVHGAIPARRPRLDWGARQQPLVHLSNVVAAAIVSSKGVKELPNFPLLRVPKKKREA